VFLACPIPQSHAKTNDVNTQLIESPEKWALFEHLSSPTYAKGCFCILGDAAHATTPHCGAGAGFAIEDAYILAGLLSPDIIQSTSDIERAFRVYDESRRPRSQELVRRSHSQGMTFDMQGEDGVKLTEEGVRESLTNNMAWVWDVDLAAVLKDAKIRLRNFG
jgi:salicylate hydroxylase